MKHLSDIIEARYVGSNRYFIIAFEKSVTEMVYDYGVTDAPPGMYTGGEDIVAVANTKEEAFEYAREYSHQVFEVDEPFEWKRIDFDKLSRKEGYGYSLESVARTLWPNSPEWHYEKY